MSLINKMLQDLDARGGAGDGALRQQQLHAVGGEVRDRRPLAIGGALLLVLLAAGGWFGWQYSQGHRAALAQPLASAATPAAAHAPAHAAPAQAEAPAPAARAHAEAPTPNAPAHAEALAPAAPVHAEVSAPAASTHAEVPAPVASTQARAAAPAASAVESAHRAAAKPVTDQTAMEPAATPEPSAPAPRRATAATHDTRRDGPVAAERKAAHTVVARSADDAVGTGTITHDISPQQMAENTYRRALVALQEGRVSAALADLDRALEIDPRNEAARQTNISLLLEQKRNDDAVRQLRLALGIDPRQPGLAMVLARLQLERGGPALDTLMTTLPYAGNSAEYQAFLAGVLQREQRHTEAAQHYREALKLAPNNGVWWMGLGISLQADMHLPEAREAYRRARASNGLTPELQAFIDRKIDSLAR